jgi:8-oxo-dGTP diphosphatase
MKVRPAALIIEADTLLTLRYNYNGTDVFMIPGGNMEFGENMQTCLAREITEELGVSASVLDLLFIAEVHQKDMDKLHCIFKTQLDNGTEPKINPLNCSALEIVYLPFEKIRKVAIYPNIPEQIYDFCTTKNLPATPFLGEISQPVY